MGSSLIIVHNFNMFSAGIFLKIEDIQLGEGHLLYAGSSFIRVNTVVNMGKQV